MSKPGGFLYAIGAEGASLVKIGCTKILENRLKALQTGYPFPLQIHAAVHVESNVQRIERYVHAFLAKERRQGEWFETTMNTAQLEALIVRAYTFFIEEEARKQREKEIRKQRTLEIHKQREEEILRKQIAKEAIRQKKRESWQQNQKLISDAKDEVLTFAQRLRGLRERKGWTQLQLTQASGVAVPVIHRLEAGTRGDTHLSVGVARRLACALGVTLDYLVGMYEDRTEKERQ